MSIRNCVTLATLRTPHGYIVSSNPITTYQNDDGGTIDILLTANFDSTAGTTTQI